MQAMMQGDHNASKMSRRTNHTKREYQYQESIGKRGVGVLVDECRRHIEEQNHQRSQSPYRDVSDISANGGYASVSARNLVVPTSTSNPFL